MKRKSKIIITDIETMASLFVVVNKNKQDDSYSIFEISDTNNQLEEMKAYYGSLNKNDYMVTYNGLDFDWPILDWILKQKKVKASHIYKYTQKLIESDEKWKFKPNHNKISQIDLFKIWHYNNKARSTSLKYLQFTTRWEKMQDIPYHHSQHLTRSQELEVIDYCINDVDSTDHFLNFSKDAINYRFELSKLYKFNFLNLPDTSIGEKLNEIAYSDATGLHRSKFVYNKTHQSLFEVKDLIPNNIIFETPKFNQIIDQMKKESFDDSKKQSEYNKYFSFDNFSVKFGKGGLHSEDIARIESIENDENMSEEDVGGMYPASIINQGIYPRHLGPEWNDNIKKNHFKRLNVIKPKLKILDKKSEEYKKLNTEQAAIKLSGNGGGFGKLGSSFSWQYDPLQKYKITFYGQLTLLMLIEQFYLKKIKLISANTDGIVIKYKKTERPIVDNIIEKWEAITKYQLESTYYNKIFFNSVNHYIAVIKDGDKVKYKFKGFFEIDKDYHKDPSQRIVRIAIANHFINNIPVKNTIMNHLDGKEYKLGDTVIKNYGIFDFCIGKKATVSNYTLLEEGCEPKLIEDKVLRFYVANSRKKLVKKYTSGKKKGGIQAIVKGWFIEMFMNYEKKEDYNIQYLYYIEEANKLIREVEKPSNNVIHVKQTKLW